MGLRKAIGKGLGQRYDWAWFEPWLLQEGEGRKGRGRAGGLDASSDAMASASGESLFSEVVATPLIITLPCKVATLIPS